MRRLCQLIVAVVAIVMLSGCGVAARYCDEASAAAVTSHTSHPSAGWPRGPSSEEDSLDYVGLVGRCERGRVYIETGVGYMYRDGGFYGPNDIFTVSAGVKLWEAR